MSCSHAAETTSARTEPPLTSDSPLRPTACACIHRAPMPPTCSAAKYRSEVTPTSPGYNPTDHTPDIEREMVLIIICRFLNDVDTRSHFGGSTQVLELPNWIRYVRCNAYVVCDLVCFLKHLRPASQFDRRYALAQTGDRRGFHKQITAVFGSQPHQQTPQNPSGRADKGCPVTLCRVTPVGKPARVTEYNVDMTSPADCGRRAWARGPQNITGQPLAHSCSEASD